MTEISDGSPLRNPCMSSANKWWRILCLTYMHRPNLFPKVYECKHGGARLTTLPNDGNVSRLIHHSIRTSWSLTLVLLNVQQCHWQLSVSLQCACSGHTLVSHSRFLDHLWSRNLCQAHSAAYMLHWGYVFALSVFRHILFYFFLFLMQFRLWRAAAFVSSPIHLFYTKCYGGGVQCRLGMKCRDFWPILILLLYLASSRI